MILENKEAEELVRLLEEVEDPRHTRGVRYRFCDLLLMCIYAVLAGHSEATEIEYYVELNFEYFKELIGLEKIPSHDTFSRVLRFTDFEQLSGSLAGWLNERFPDICRKYLGNKVLHVDGKAVRAASEKSRGEKPIYELNAMYEGESIGVEIKRVGEKENEISCLPGYLKKFNLNDTIVSADAIACNKTVIDAIHEGGGRYMFPVKENQKNLYKEIEKEVGKLTESGAFKELDNTEMNSKNHGRIERTRMTMMENTAFLYETLGQGSFYGSIAKVGVMDKKSIQRKDGKEETTATRSYLITDVEEMTAEVMLQLKQAYWNIEMQHWLLDMQLMEDRKTAKKGNAVTNGAILRRFCLMVRKHDEKLSSKPLNRFLMSNNHDIKRIECLLFEKMAISD